MSTTPSHSVACRPRLQQDASLLPTFNCQLSIVNCQLLAALGLLLLLLASLPAGAVPPPNDNCSGAHVIPSGSFPYLAPVFEITDATSNSDPTTLPTCQTNVTRSIWYRFTPTNDEFYTFSTCPDETTVNDTVVAIYTSAVGCSDPSQFNLIACADDSSGGCLTKAVLTAPLTANTTYYIIIWQYSKSQITPGSANIKLVVSKTLPPPNDTCANAQPLTLNIPVAGATLAANDDYETTVDCFTEPGQKLTTASGRDVVYTFIAPATDTYSVKVYNYTSDPNELVIYATSFCPAAGPVFTFDSVLAAANRVIGGTAEELFCLPLTAGQQIYIFVDEDTLTAGSTFRIEVTLCRPEIKPNNSPETAAPLPCGVEGSLSRRYENNYFSLGTFPAGFRAFALIDSSATLPTDFALQIETATNTLQYAYKNNDPAFGANAANIAGTILPPEPTFVQVYDPVHYAKEPYRLYAVVQPPIEMATWETEPNNSYADANSAPNNYFRGSLPTNTDVDVFMFNAKGGDLIFVSLDCDPLRDLTPINARLELLDADGKTLLTVNPLNPFYSTNVSQGFIYKVAEEGDFYVRVSISPDATGPVAAGDYLLSIAKNCFIGEFGANTPPRLTNLAVTTPITEGDTAILSGEITDPDTGEAFTLSVDWGDGSAIETVVLLAGVYSFNVPHVYSDNATAGYAINLTVSDYSGATCSSNAVVAVNNAPPAAPVLQLSANSIFENDVVTLDGAFTDPGLLDTHAVVIDWGDGSSASSINLAAGETTFSATHRYLDDNPTATPWDTYTIAVTVTDKDSAFASSSIPLIVSNLPPVLSSVSISSPIMPGQAAVLSGAFSDVGALDTFILEVNWGDGTASQTNQLGSTTSFSVPHTYTVANTNLSVSVTVRDDDGGSVSTNLPITIQMPMNASLALLSTNSWYWLQLHGTPGVAYRLQTSTNLQAWGALGTLTPNTSGFSGLALTNDHSAAPRFFRALFP